MRVGSFGEFVVIARTRRQGTRWTGSFKINRLVTDFTASVPYDEEQSIEETFDSSGEAEDAAFFAGQMELERRAKRGGQ